jgi:hypothetical protein
VGGAILFNAGFETSSVERLVDKIPKAYSAKKFNFSRSFGSHAALRVGLINALVIESYFLK